MLTETGMTVVYQHLTAECFCGIVVDTACAVGDIPQDDDLMAVGAELVDDVRDDEGELEESLWHLEAEDGDIVLIDLVYGLVQFEVVVLGKRLRDE